MKVALIFGGRPAAFLRGFRAVYVALLVNSIIMPIVTPFIPGGAWQTATFAMGPVILSWGAFLAALLNFVIIALVVFIIAKKVLKEEKVTKK